VRWPAALLHTYPAIKWRGRIRERSIVCYCLVYQHSTVADGSRQGGWQLLCAGLQLSFIRALQAS
jgi:hypothetical protein